MIDTERKVEACCDAVREHGYGVLPGVLDDAGCERALALVHEWEQRTADLEIEGGPPYLARGSDIVWNLHHKDARFLDLVLRQPAIESVVKHFLNDLWYRGLEQNEPNYVLRGLNARSSGDALPLHLDSFIPYEGDTVISMQAVISLVGMTENNGATLVVPGSHLIGRYFDPELDSPEAVPVLAEPGDVVFWDSRIWHGAGANLSGRPRWTVNATFTRWWIKEAFRTTEVLPEAIYAHLTDREKTILGFSTLPFFHESEGIDQRRGHGALKRRVSDYREPESS